jgi:hypothetical protein
MPPPRFNLNAARNGKRLVRLTVGELPRQLHCVKVEGRRYRVALEEATAEVHGGVDVLQAHAIDTATAAMIHVGICRWLLRERIGTMSPADILTCSREMVRAKETRDRAVARLALDRIDQDSIDALYANPQPPALPAIPLQPHTTACNATNVLTGYKHPPTPTNATRANVANDNGCCPDCNGEGCPTCRQRSQ